MMGLRTLEVSELWPLLVLRFPSVVDVDAVKAMMAAFDRALARDARFLSILDATDVARFPDGDARAALTGWMNDEARKKREVQRSLGSAVVLPSAALRAFVAAIYVVHKPQSPQHWCRTFPEALAWGCDQVVQAGMPLTPAIEALRARTAADEARRSRGGS